MPQSMGSQRLTEQLLYIYIYIYNCIYIYMYTIVCIYNYIYIIVSHCKSTIL